MFDVAGDGPGIARIDVVRSVANGKADVPRYQIAGLLMDVCVAREIGAGSHAELDRKRAVCIGKGLHANLRKNLPLPII